MRTMFFATAAALTLGAVAAHADGGGFATTRFTTIQDQLSGRAQPAPAAPQAVADQPSAVQTNAAQTEHLGTWLNDPAQGNGN
jgi:hypothetical protein